MNQHLLIKEIIINSYPNKLRIILQQFLKNNFSELIKNSFFINHIKGISLFFACLLIFLSPFVSTSINAVLVLLAVFTTFIFYFTPQRELSDTSESEPPLVFYLYIPVMLYMAIAIIAVGFSPYFIPALKGFAKMIIFLFSYIVFISNIRDIKSLKWMGISLIISSVIVSIYGIWQFYMKVPPLALWDDPDALTKLIRVYSTLKNPNLLAGYLIVPLALSSVFAITVKGWLKLIFIPVLYVQIACLYYTYSRGGWIGCFGLLFIFALCLLFVYKEKIKKIPYYKIIFFTVTIIGIGLIIFIFYKSPALQERLSSFLAFRGHSSNSFRLNVWTAVITMIKDYWSIGIGPGTAVFKQIYPLYMASGFDALAAYNIFLEVMVEFGIFGIIIFLWLVLSYLKQAVKNMNLKENFVKILNAGCFAGILGLMLHGMVDTVFYRPQVQILFWFLLAIIVKTSRENSA